MKRIIIAAALASAGFVSVAAVEPLFAQENAAPSPEETRAQALARADERFDRLDTNKDGKLSPDELMAARGPRGDMPPPPPPPPPGAEGAPPPAEGAPPPPPPSDDRRGMPGRFGQRMFARLDTNGDGFISQDEYRAMAGERFDRIDTNHDGKIDADEREAARDAMMDRMGGRHGRGAPPPDGAPPPPSDPNAGQ